MEYEQFDQAANRFVSLAKSLLRAAEDGIQQSRDAFGGRCLPDARPEQMAELILRNVQQRVSDVMFTYDQMLAALGMPPTFAVYFRSRELTETGWNQLWDVLDKERVEGPDGSPE